jgi:hypothetical protein
VIISQIVGTDELCWASNAQKDDRQEKITTAYLRKIKIADIGIFQPVHAA